MARPIAVLCGDLHFSHTPPVARAETRKEWYAVQEGYCEQLNSIANGLPIICAGDVVHSWDQPHELTHHLSSVMPVIHSIPGQHDLPQHSLADIHRSAYWTLVWSGRIVNLRSELGPRGKPESKIDGMLIFAFPWGERLQKPRIKDREIYTKKDVLFLAVAHQYVWTNHKNCYPTAKEESNIHSIGNDVMASYDAILTGDNHKSFVYNYNPEDEGGTWLMNCGTFMRRRADERNHKPHVGVLWTDGRIERKYLDTSGDKWRDEANDIAEANLANVDLHEVADMLKKLSAQTDDYIDALTRLALEQKDPKMRATMLRIAEESQ